MPISVPVAIGMAIPGAEKKNSVKMESKDIFEVGILRGRMTSRNLLEKVCDIQRNF